MEESGEFTTISQSEVLLEQAKNNAGDPEPEKRPPATITSSYIPSFLKSADGISKLNRFILTNQDSHLSTIGYPSLLVAALLKKLAKVKNPTIRYWIRVLMFRTDPNKVAKILKNLYTLTSDIRTYIRVWSLLDYVEWTISSCASPSEDVVVRSIEYVQLVSSIWYQVLEDIAYLGSKKVIPMTSNTEYKLWAYSCMGWAIYVYLDYAKMFLQYRETGKVDWRSFIINTCWAPLSIHWSTGNGLLSEFAVGLLGSIAVLSKSIPKWKRLLKES